MILDSHQNNLLALENLNALLQPLSANAKPLWGKMTAQYMIEHLTDAVDYSNGKYQTDLEVPIEEALHKKAVVLQHDFIIPKGIKGPDDGTKTLQHPDISSAVQALNQAVQNFHDYFQQKSITTMHPGFGPLTYKEWLVFHTKHFSHHFRQFGLMP